MKFFSLISQDIDVAPNAKIMAPEEFATVVNAQELLDQVVSDTKAYKQAIEQECEDLKEAARKQGFDEGMKTWSEQLSFLEKEVHDIQNKVKAAIVPLAIASIKKIIGKELELNPNTVISLITNALKAVNQNKRVTIFVNPVELETIEQGKPEFKKILEYADSIILSPKSNIEKGGCIIETESGIINAQITAQLQALEKAFNEILKEPIPTPEVTEHSDKSDEKESSQEQE